MKLGDNMIIIDGDLIELTNENGETFDELAFLPYLNEQVLIKGDLTLRKLKMILNDYPILKTIYFSFNIFIDQYNYDEMMKIKNEDSIYTKIIVKNKFRFQKNNFTVKQVVNEREIIQGLKSRMINVEYEKGDSIAFEMLTVLSLLDNQRKECSVNLVDLKDIIDVPIEIYDGKLSFTESVGIFNEEEDLINMSKEDLESDIETQISFNELMMTISERPDFNSIRNKKARRKIEQGKNILKKIFNIDDMI